ncbi:cupin domain-containing protein [bacterium]|nr:MAG: cupin domain-containing protein [bacterium]
MAEWTDEGCPIEGPMPIAPLHLHEHCDEAWVVHEGRLVVQSGDEIVTLGKGDAVLVPAGTPHTFWNPDPTPCRYLLVMTGLTWRLIQAIHAADDRSPEAMGALFESHGARLIS